MVWIFILQKYTLNNLFKNLLYEIQYLNNCSILIGYRKINSTHCEKCDTDYCK